MTIHHPSFGELPDDRVIIFDTTLRDGEQSPGFSMNLDEKLRMAEALADLGVDVMEAGFPIASAGDFDSVRAIAERIRGPVICGLARTGQADILRAAEALRMLEQPESVAARRGLRVEDVAPAALLKARAEVPEGVSQEVTA